MRGVDAQQLDPEPPERVSRNVDGEQSSLAQAHPLLDGEHDPDDDEVPQRLVEERGVEGGGRRELPRSMSGVDLQAPRQGRRPAEQLLVEPVPPPPDRLGESEGGSGGVGEGPEVDVAAARHPPGGERAPRHPAPDAQAPVPDAQGVERSVVVQLVVGGHVVQPGPDQPSGDRPHGDVGDRAPLAAPGLPPPPGEEDGREDPQQDAQRVGPQRDRSEVHDAPRRARDGRRQGQQQAGGRRRGRPEHGHR